MSSCASLLASADPGGKAQEVHGTADDSGKLAFKRDQTEQANSSGWIEPGREVHVAVGLGITAGNRAGQEQAPDAGVA